MAINNRILKKCLRFSIDDLNWKAIALLRGISYPSGHDPKLSAMREEGQVVKPIWYHKFITVNKAKIAFGKGTNPIAL